MKKRTSYRRLYTSLLCVITLIFVCTVFSGCISVDSENKTVFTLSEDGTISQTIVDDADETVTGEELENYINDEITAFQSQGNNESVSLETCRVRNGKVNITLVYSSASAYASFNNVTCFSGTLKEAYEAGYDFNRNLYDTEGSAFAYTDLTRYISECRILIIEEECSTALPGELFVASEGVSEDENGDAVVEANPDESYSEDVQGANADFTFLIYKA